MIIIFKALGICPLVHNNDADEPVNNRMNRKHLWSADKFIECRFLCRGKRF